ncbi:hypothetical protein [Saliphagus infecundisoli]|uniref:Uncharacterized protein n=1 Tax=Saliphagus infecundisoli TaxID=1849069 RepID=A0ABD5QGS9_9EURY|nr:hypothetical protein [Saliphagus infecundisoli]
MTERTVSLRRVLAGPATLATYAVLVVPLAAGWLRTAWMTPLALPGYLIYVVGTAIGNALSARFEFWAYWVPFTVGCYAVSVAVGYCYELLRIRGSSGTGAAEPDRRSTGR